MGMGQSQKVGLALAVPLVVSLGLLWVLNNRARPVEWKTVDFGEDVDRNGKPVQIPEGHSLVVPEGEMNGPALKAPPEIDSESPDGYSDLVFHTKSAKFELPAKEKGKQGPHGRGYAARGKWKGKQVGFEVLLIEPWEAWTPSGMKSTMYQSYAMIHSTGNMSDEFLGALATMYQVPQSSPKMAPMTVAQVMVLQGNPSQPGDGILKMKLFFGDEEGSADYAEIFLNVDLKKERLMLVEKDTAYRAAVIRALTTQSRGK